MPFSGGQPIHVLIVDDDAGSRLLMRRALERSGFVISEAADGNAAVAAVETGQCNAVLMDVEMPLMNGYEACKAIRARAGGTHLPIMMVTGRDDVGSIKILDEETRFEISAEKAAEFAERVARIGSGEKGVTISPADNKPREARQDASAPRKAWQTPRPAEEGAAGEPAPDSPAKPAKRSWPKGDFGKPGAKGKPGFKGKKPFGPKGPAKFKGKKKDPQ